MKFLIYARVSPRGSDYEGETSIPMQIQYCREYVKFHGGEVIAERFDEFCSGKDTERPEFSQIMTELENGTAPWDVIIVYKLSRMTRSLRDGANIFAELFRHGKGFVSATENLDYSSPIGRLQLGIMQVFNQFEREQTAENTRNKMVSIASKGEWPAGNAPFGYMRIGKKNNVLHPEPRKAESVKAMFEMYLSDTPLFKIAKQFKKTPQGVLHILRNITYTGVIRYNGKIYPGKHEAIISEGEFNMVQARLSSAIPDCEDNNVSRPKMQKYPYVLSGLLRCRCGKYLTPASSKSGQYHYYRCTDNINCKRRVNAGKIETAVIDVVKNIKIDEEERLGLMSLFAKLQEARRKSVIPELNSVREALSMVTKERDNIVRTILDSGISEKNKKFFNTELERLNTEIERLEGKRSYLQNSAENNSNELFRDDLEKIFSDMVAVSQNIDQNINDPTALRNIIAATVEKISEISPEEWEITFHYRDPISTSISKNGNPTRIRT